MRRHRRATRRPRLGPLRLLRHHPIAYWTVVAALALTTGAIVASVSRDARAAADAYGELERVAVARHTLDAGEVIGGRDVEWRELPVVLVPDDRPGEVVDQVVSATIFAGEPIVAGRLAPAGAGAVAARVASGRQAVAVPLTVGAPTLEVGDVVDLLAIAEPDPAGPPPTRVARDVSVVDVADEFVTVAVDDDDVRATARAVGTGAVVIVLTSPHP